MAHSKVAYRHLFYAINASAPFQVVARSPYLDLPHRSARHVQFAAGLVCRAGETLVISYGDDDCSARFTSIHVDAVARLLRVPGLGRCATSGVAVAESET
eukprot:2536230-Prymnesium_polylepis.1